MSFKFIKIKDSTNEFDKADITFLIKEEDLTLSELVEIFRNFLSACGYGSPLVERITVSEAQDDDKD